MKKVYLTLSLLLLLAKSYGQQVHSIKFIYCGTQLKPIGTVVISVEEPVQPNEVFADSLFGKNGRVNIETYKAVSKLIKNRKYLTYPDPNFNFFKIVDSDGFTLRLAAKKYGLFWDALRSILAKRNYLNVVDLF